MVDLGKIKKPLLVSYIFGMGGAGIHLPFPAVLLHAEDTPRINFRANKLVKQKYISEISAIKLSHNWFELLYSRQKIFL